VWVSLDSICFFVRDRKVEARGSEKEGKRGEKLFRALFQKKKKKKNEILSLPLQVPALNIFESSLKRGKFDANRTLSDGSLMEFAHILPMDAGERARLDFWKFLIFLIF